MVPVSAVVSAHNEGEFLRECIESIQSQTYPVEELIIIVDRGNPETLETAMETPAIVYEIQYGNIYQTKRFGICIATNDTVLAVDGDTELAPDFLERGLYHLEQGYDVATGHVRSRDRTPMGDLAAIACNVLPKGVYASGPGFVLNRRHYMDTFKITKINGFIDIATGASEVPLQRMNLCKDPEMLMWTELPSTGQKRMITGARAVGGLLTALRVLA